MAVSDAVTARGMSQRIHRVTSIIHQNFIDQNALLYLAQKNGRIKWGGSHTEFEWFIRREQADVPTWGGGELGIRTFEEVNPANRAHLPYCYIEKTYGVSQRSLEANRHAQGRQKIYDLLKENLVIAQINLYDALVPSLWTGGESGDGGDEPIGMDKVVGEAYQSTHDVAVGAGKSYANQTLNTSAVTAWAVGKTAWDSVHWAPIALNIQEVPSNTDGSATWAGDCLKSLAYLAQEMEVTRNVSGTGKPVKPDAAFMRSQEFAAVTAKLLASQYTYNIPIGQKDVTLAKFPNVVVDSLTCIKDSNVPVDTNSIPRVFAIDSREFHIHTTHTKAEGLIINEFETDNTMISGATGVLRCNLGYMVTSPTAVGTLVGCD